MYRWIVVLVFALSQVAHADEPDSDDSIPPPVSGSTESQPPSAPAPAPNQVPSPTTAAPPAPDQDPPNLPADAPPRPDQDPPNPPAPPLTSPTTPDPATSGIGNEGVDLADPMGPIEAVLDDLDTRPSVRVTQRQRSVDRLRGETLTARIEGADGGLLQFMLERVAEDGYQLLLEPIAPRTYQLVALRSQPGQTNGVALVAVVALKLTGEARRGESLAMLRKLLVVPSGGVLPLSITEQIAVVGYRATLQATGKGEVTLSIVPGRSIRRVRVHGELPLSEREVRRVLSPRARPGALAPSACQPRRDRRGPRRTQGARPGGVGVQPSSTPSTTPPLRSSSQCDPTDLVCREWERTEQARLERLLSDNGYLQGRVSLTFVCGDEHNVDLHITLRKGPAYRIGEIKVSGNVSTQSQRWIRRTFRPTISPVIRIPSRVTRKRIEQAKEQVAREYAEPRSSGTTSTRRGLQLPYPGVRVDTNFDRIRTNELPTGRRIPLNVDVQLGSGVKTEFLFNEHIGDNRLRSQLKLFKRREPADEAAARRESAHLRGFYQSRGYMLADVRGDFNDFGSLPTLSFTIDEGPRVRVRQVQLKIGSGPPPAVIDDVELLYVRARTLERRARFTDTHAREDLAKILTAFNERGYLCAQAQMRVAFWPQGLDTQGAYAVIDPLTELQMDGTPTWLEEQLDPSGLAALRNERRAGVYLRVDVIPGPRIVTSGIEQLQYLEQPIPSSRVIEGLPTATEGAWGTLRMLRDGPLRRVGDARASGIPINLTLDREAERDIVRRYRASGYPLADAEVRWRYVDPQGVEHRVAQADRLTSDSVGVCMDHADQAIAPVDLELSVYEGRSGRFGTTLVRGNFKTRRRVLLNEKTWNESDPYDQRQVDETLDHIERIGVTESVQVREQQVGCQLDDDEEHCVVHHVLSIKESKDRALDVTGGIGGATLDPLYVFLRPTLPNMLGTGWDLQLDGHLGFGNVFTLLRSSFCGDENCYERSARASLSRPRIFASPLTFDLSGRIQRRLTPARGRIDSALGQLRLTWPVGEQWRVYAGYLAQIANISKSVVKPIVGVEQGCTQADANDPLCRISNRGEAIVADRTGAVQAGAVWQKIDNPFNPDQGVILTVDGLFATPSLGNDWWLRGDVSWQQFIPIPRTDDRLNFRYSIRYGHAKPLPRLPGSGATSIPEIWRYLGGGTTDLGIRGIEPQTMLVDVETIRGPLGTLTLRPSAQGGHIRALGTVALQVVSVPDFLGGTLAHSLFLDVGVLTQRWRQVRLQRDLRRSVGVNFVKWDIGIVTVSVGYAVLVPEWLWPGGNVGPTDDRNGRFVFDVGATF